MLRAMKSKREGNTRFRLVLTLGLAVVLPALTLIFVNFQHVKSIQRDKKVEALIHRDFQYVLSISAKKLTGKGYELTEKARDAFPTDSDSDADKEKKFDLLLSQSPWFAHVFLFDSKKGVIVRQQPDRPAGQEVGDLQKMYGAWFVTRKPVSHRPNAQENQTNRLVQRRNGAIKRPDYITTAIFSFPQHFPDRAVLGGVSFDTTT